MGLGVLVEAGVDESRRGGRRVVSIMGVLLSLAGPAILVDVKPVQAMAALGHRADGQANDGRAMDGRATDGRATDGEAAVRRTMGLGVPAYWSAGEPGGAAAFERLLTATPTVDTVIVNGPASGPADPFDPELAAAIRRLSAAGVTVLGYVDTGYLGRTGQVTTRRRAGSTDIAAWRSQAGADVVTWYRLYHTSGLGGIFFDQTPPDCGPDDAHLDAYRAIARRVWRRDAGSIVAINPGTAVQECYTAVADLIVIAEDSLAGYRSWTPPPWARQYPRTMFWHLVHGISSAAELNEALALAVDRHAGQVYLTDAVLDNTGGPWNTLPSDPYWNDQLGAVSAIRLTCP